MSLVTLLTDFGTADGYVAEVKGVVLSLAPGAGLVDITHDIAAGDVRAGAYVLGRAWRRFPPGTVHLAVVDPGVGTARRALAAEAAGHYFVAPDNGLLASLPDGARYVSLPVPPNAAPTFHGRDVFAPAAAALAHGTALARLGVPVTDPSRSPLPAIDVRGGVVTGEVVHVDHFGTLITNIPAAAVAARARVRVGARAAGPVRRTFADVPRGRLVAYPGSDGTIEIAVRDGSAAKRLGAGRGATVRVG
jgi:S-adenosylmethionine hydrolase